MAASSNERRQGFGKEKGIDFVRGKCLALDLMKDINVRDAVLGTGTKRFHRQSVAALRTQVRKKQRRQHGFADAGVGAGYEDDLGAHAGNS